MAAYNPSFVLKRISFEKVLQEYLSGKFSKLAIDKTIAISSLPSVVCNDFSNNPNSPIYTSDTSKCDSPILVSTNQKSFDVYYLTGKRPTGLCDWCRKFFDHESTGMVIEYKSTIYFNPDTGKAELYEIFWVYGHHCKFECSLSDIQERRKGISTSHVFNYDNSECHTRKLFSLITGKRGNELKPESHWELLKRNGGSVEDSDGHIYIATNGVHLAPVKLFFERR